MKNDVYSQKWKDVTLIGFDLETTGKYPLEAEICEMAAVKWKGGQVIDKYQTLVKPSHPMSEEVIKIHNITNKMVETAPPIQEKLSEFYEFIKDGFLVAHHSPFDMGFLAIEFEKMGLSLPENPVFCSSLISRKAIPESENHKLQTLIPLLGLSAGTAHRALDDANACLELTLKCFERIGEEASLDQIFKFQGGGLRWSDFSMNQLKENPVLGEVIKATVKHEPIQIIYEGGSNPGKARTVYPMGIVRSPRGDFLVAKSDLKDEFPKRYFLSRISGTRI